MTDRISYPLALVGGVAFAVWLFSWPDLFPAAPFQTAFIGDQAASVIGQRYFLGGPWVWPLLRIPDLADVNAALTDSIPLALLVLKPFHTWLMPGASVSQTWVALAFAVQPVAAVFALRSLGERRLWPAVAVAALSVSMPTLLARYGHMALCSHAAILLGLGLYFRLTSGRRCWPFAVLLMMAALLIHPYIFANTLAVLAATPLTLLLRGDRRWLRAAAGFGAGLFVCGASVRLLGMSGSIPTEGFGFFSMNLFGPILPNGSSFLPSLAYDATGGQAFEGDQYLGVGLLLLIIVGLVLAVRARISWRRHSGLLMVLFALTVFSMSNVAYAGPWLLFHWRPVPNWVTQFRATGRFFWPVAYAALVLAVAVIAQRWPRHAGAAVLSVAVLLQVADTHTRRTAIREDSRTQKSWVINAALLRPIFAQHRQLTVWPTFSCGALPIRPVDIQVILLASETLMRTNTTAAARDVSIPDCDPARTLAQPLLSDELRVLLHRGGALRVPDARRRCRDASPLVLCSVNDAVLAGLPLIDAIGFPTDRNVTDADPAFRDALTYGWAGETGPVWTNGRLAMLQFRRPPFPSVLLLNMVGFAPVPGGQQVVSVAVDGQSATTWHIPENAISSVSVPVPAEGPEVCAISLTIGQPTRPLDRGYNADGRELGVQLRSLQLNAVN